MGFVAFELGGGWAYHTRLHHFGCLVGGYLVGLWDLFVLSCLGFVLSSLRVGWFARLISGLSGWSVRGDELDEVGVCRDRDLYSRIYRLQSINRPYVGFFFGYIGSSILLLSSLHPYIGC